TSAGAAWGCATRSDPIPGVVLAAHGDVLDAQPELERGWTHASFMCPQTTEKSRLAKTPGMWSIGSPSLAETLPWNLRISICSSKSRHAHDFLPTSIRQGSATDGPG